MINGCGGGDEDGRMSSSFPDILELPFDKDSNPNPLVRRFTVNTPSLKVAYNEKVLSYLTSKEESTGVY